MARDGDGDQMEVVRWWLGMSTVPYTATAVRFAEVRGNVTDATSRGATSTASHFMHAVRFPTRPLIPKLAEGRAVQIFRMSAFTIGINSSRLSSALSPSLSSAFNPQSAACTQCGYGGLSSAHDR